MYHPIRGLLCYNLLIIHIIDPWLPFILGGPEFFGGLTIVGKKVGVLLIPRGPTKICMIIFLVSPFSCQLE